MRIIIKSIVILTAIISAFTLFCAALIWQDVLKLDKLYTILFVAVGIACFVPVFVYGYRDWYGIAGAGAGPGYYPAHRARRDGGPRQGDGYSHFPTRNPGDFVKRSAHTVRHNIDASSLANAAGGPAGGGASVYPAMNQPGLKLTWKINGVSFENELFSFPAVIGRGEVCDVVIRDMGVSRRHIQIAKNGDDFFIEDLGSSNGTYVDGSRAVTATPIDHSSKVSIGGVILSFSKLHIR